MCYIAGEQEFNSGKLWGPSSSGDPHGISWDLSNNRVSIQVHCPCCSDLFLAQVRFLWTLPPQPPTHTSIPKIPATPRSGHLWRLQGPSPWPFKRMGGLQQWLFYLQHVACKIIQKGEKEQRRFCFLTTLVLRWNTCLRVHLTDDGPLGTGQAGGDGHNRGWGGWMASSTRWTWVWVNSGSWWWTGRPGVLQSTGSQRVGHSWTELNWTGPGPGRC